MTRARIFLSTTAVTAILATGLLAAKPAADEATVQHVLNRITFGATREAVNVAMRIGLEHYVDEQLHPERAHDTSLADRLRGFDTLSLDLRAIADRYERPLLEERVRQARAGDPVQVPPTDGATPTRTQQQANQPLVELASQKVLRATYSEQQLEEVLVDFWFNHFNVDARKGPTRFMLTEYEREAIRPHVLGHFRDLLGATAHSPAMLFYLDNWQSADPSRPHLDRVTPQARGQFGNRLRQRRPAGQQPRTTLPNGQPAQQRQRPTGLNENYGRELLELHTLGVDGGYTQKDVTEVARAFTGWTIDQPRAGGGFRFAPALHDDGEKVVLGHRIKAGGGESDGEAVLDIVAAHPSTARFISTKLARRFVGDTPPPSLVARMANTFERTKGDLRAVMSTLLSSKEFREPSAEAVKVKTPFEFVVSALRITGADVQDARPVFRAVQQLGMPLYQCQPPTGYVDRADSWVNTGALVGRMNIALALADNRLPGVRITAPDDALTLLGGHVSDATRNTIAKAQTPAQSVALALGSPEFQRR